MLDVGDVRFFGVVAHIFSNTGAGNGFNVNQNF